MAMVSQIPLPIPKHRYPWTTTYLSIENAGCNKDRLTGHADLKWARDSQLSEFFLDSVPSCKSEVRRDVGTQGGK